jgi:hypothetical protein
LDVIWIEFSDPFVGKLQREKFHELYDKNISPSWTSIFGIANPFLCTRGKNQTTIQTVRIFRHLGVS